MIILVDNKILTLLNKNKRNLLLWIYLFSLFGYMFFDISEFSNTILFAVTLSRFFKLFTISSILILSLIWLKKTRLISFILLFILATINYIYSNSTNFLLINSILFIVLELGKDDFIKFDFKIRLSIVLIIIACSILGIIQNYSFARYPGDPLRYSFGFLHPNSLALQILIISLEYILLYKKRLILILVVNIITFLITNSRTSLICFCLFLILYWIISYPSVIKIINKIKKLLILISSYIPFVFSFFSLILSLGYDPTSFFYYIFNSLLSGRIKMANYFLSIYNINLFGNELILTSTRESILNDTIGLVLDLGYIKMILTFGIVITILLLYFYGIVLKNNVTNNSFLEFIICLVLLIYGLFESSIIDPYCCLGLYLVTKNTDFYQISSIILNKLYILKNIIRRKFNHE